jgi:hypothetical protein
VSGELCKQSPVLGSGSAGPDTKALLCLATPPPSTQRPKHQRTPWDRREFTLYLNLISLQSQCSFPQVCHPFTLTPKSVIGSYSLSPWSWCDIRLLSLCSSHLHAGSSQILVGVLRHYVVVLLQSSPTKLPRAAIREQCVLVSDTYPGRE